MEDMARKIIPLQLELPPYLRSRCENGRFKFHFEVPERHRPAKWPATFRLPRASAKRTGLGDLAEWQEAIQDAKELYAKLTVERTGIPLQKQAKEGTFAWVLERYQQSNRYRNKSKTTKRHYDWYASKVLEWGADRRVADVTHIELQDFVSTMDATPFKQKNVTTFLRELMRRARKEKLRTDFPELELDLAKKPVSFAREIKAAEVAAFVKTADLMDPMVGLAVLIAWWHGWRESDIVTMIEGRHYIAPKFQRWSAKNDCWLGVRTVPEIVERIKKRNTGLAVPSTYVTFNPRTGLPWNDRVFDRRVQQIASEAGLERFQFRWLRHTVQTQLEALGVSRGAQASLVGHKPSSHDKVMEQHYLIESEELAEQAIAALEQDRK